MLRLRALMFPRRVERELDEELAFHIEREAQKHIARGLSPRDARREARARFGSVPLAADACRDVRGTSGVDDLARDVLYAFRTFRRAPLVSSGSARFARTRQRTRSPADTPSDSAQGIRSPH